MQSIVKKICVFKQNVVTLHRENESNSGYISQPKRQHIIKYKINQNNN